MSQRGFSKAGESPVMLFASHILSIQEIPFDFIPEKDYFLGQFARDLLPSESVNSFTAF
jgi:hypothetical protein